VNLVAVFDPVAFFTLRVRLTPKAFKLTNF